MKSSELSTLAPYIGDLMALLGMKEYIFTEGKEKGVRAIDVRNGKGLEMTVLADKCLDIPYLSVNGINIGFVSKTGIVGNGFFQENGVTGFLKQFDAGFLTTGGITYAGSPGEIDGRSYGLHGCIFNAPARNVNKEMIMKDGQMLLRITGEMQESCVFQENMFLRRELLLETERNVLHIHDEVENRGFRTESVMNVYHINFGYPMLEAGCRVYTNADKVVPRDAEAESGFAEYRNIGEPVVDYKEQCFFHTHEKPDQNSYAMLYNPGRGMAAVIHYDARQCPILCEWKNQQAGDYALGLEPTTCGVQGKAKAIEDHTIRYLEPGEKQQYQITVEFLTEQSDIDRYINNRERTPEE